jgi:hypothetical protein
MGRETTRTEPGEIKLTPSKRMLTLEGMVRPSPELSEVNEENASCRSTRSI